MKHVTDRYVIEHIVLARKESNSTKPFHFSYDETQKYVMLLCKLMLLVLAIFLLMLSLFFSLRGRSAYIPHTIACSIMLFGILVRYL